MCPHTSVMLWLLPLWFVSVYSSRQKKCLFFFSYQTFFAAAAANGHLSLWCLSSSDEQNEYLLSAYVTKEMSQHCKQVSYSKWKCANKSSLLAVNEMKWRGKLWGSIRISRVSSVLILSPRLLISAETKWCLHQGVLKQTRTSLRCSQKWMKMMVYSDDMEWGKLKEVWNTCRRNGRHSFLHTTRQRMIATFLFISDRTLDVIVWNLILHYIGPNRSIFFSGDYMLKHPLELQRTFENLLTAVFSAATDGWLLTPSNSLVEAASDQKRTLHGHLSASGSICWHFHL